MMIKHRRSIAGLSASALAGGILTAGLLITTPGCGPEATHVTEPAATNNAPPGNSSAEDYNKKMMELQGKRGGVPPGPGPSGPSGRSGPAPTIAR